MMKMHFKTPYMNTPILKMHFDPKNIIPTKNLCYFNSTPYLQLKLKYF